MPDNHLTARTDTKRESLPSKIGNGEKNPRKADAEQQLFREYVNSYLIPTYLGALLWITCAPKHVLMGLDCNNGNHV